jgi:tRNA-uridine 2-sulfurtransferase
MAKTVFVGLSGGVDSSVAALRLKQQGYQVVGVFIKVWHPEWLVCNWEQERLDAMRVAARLEIPFLTCDAEAAYRDEVANYFIASYQAGRTPNPDVMCNKEVKFGAFYRFAKDHGADYIATGHYAVKLAPDALGRGVDETKDQSYFLWTLTTEQLRHTLFPIGDTPKEQIRREAAAAGLPTATKRDSQGVCFLGHIDIPDFLSHYIDLKPGPVITTDGTIVGTHQGAFVYTVGQRHGFTITKKDASTSPSYVVGKDITTNTITVSHEPPQISTTSTITLEELVWRGTPLTSGDTFEAQFRYRQTPFPVTITAVTDRKVVISVNAVTDTPASGQSCVLYRGSHCLGGGIIS